MPLGEFEKTVLRLIAANRNPDSFIGGATVLNQAPATIRSSRDVDIFHDASDALESAVATDSRTLEQAGFTVDLRRSFPGFTKAIVSRGTDRTRLEWLMDSAFRFFPVEADEELGYRLNFWDAATNKVLAAVGRAEIRDYLDLIQLHCHHLSLGALVWAAAGKDHGLTPVFILDELARLQRYPAESYRRLSLVRAVDPAGMKTVWLEALADARVLFDAVLGTAPVGCLFLDDLSQVVTPTTETLPHLTPHFGSLRGCLPRIFGE